MVLSFPTKSAISFLRVDAKGQFLALGLSEGSVEIHATEVESEPIKIPPEQETLAIVVSAYDNQSVSIESIECLSSRISSARSLFNFIPLNIYGVNKSQSPNGILPVQAPPVAISTSTNIALILYQTEISIFAVRTRPYSRVSKNIKLKNSKKEVQLILCCKLAVEAFTTAAATVQYVFTAKADQIHCFKINDLFRISERDKDGTKRDMSSSLICYCKSTLQFPDTSVEARTAKGCGVNKAVVLDTWGNLYFVQVFRRAVAKDDTEASLICSKLDLNFCSSIFDVRQLEIEEGSKLLICDDHSVLHVILVEDLLEIEGTKQMMETTFSVSEERSIVCGDLVKYLAFMNDTSFFISHPSTLNLYQF